MIPEPGVALAGFSTKSWRLERAANVIFGLNVWLWAVLGLTMPAPDERLHVVRLCIAAIHVVVGLLFLMRRPLIRSGRPGDILAAVPAVVLSGLAFAHAPRCSDWPWFAVGLFTIGTILAIAAFGALARHFAVLPAVRGVTTSGAYRFVRHPAYLGETIMVLACCTAQIDIAAIAILLATVLAVIARIRAEEALFARAGVDSSRQYADYCETIRYRIFPGLW